MFSYARGGVRARASCLIVSLKTQTYLPQLRKVAVSYDGRLFRATNKDIETALKRTRDVPSGLSVETYLKVCKW